MIMFTQSVMLYHSRTVINRTDHLINEEILKTCKYSVKKQKKLIMQENIEKITFAMIIYIISVKKSNIGS